MNLTVHHPNADYPPQARRLLGDTTGIIRNLLWYLPDRTDPDLYYATAIEADLEPSVGNVVGSLDAGGTGLTRRAAFLSALGEAAERYALYLPDTDRMIMATYHEMAGQYEMLPKRYLDIFDAGALARTRLSPVRPTVEMAWYPTTNLLSGDRVYVPAQLVWLASAHDGDALYFPTTSNGTACGATPMAALRGALSEYIERDGIMRAWYTQRPTRSIDIESVPGIEPLLRDRFAAEGFNVRCFEAPSPLGSPVVGCAIVNSQHRPPKVGIGGDFSIGRKTAYESALIEAAQTWAYVKDLAAAGLDIPSIDPGEIYNLTDNLRYYAAPAQFDDLEGFLGLGPTKDSQLTPGSMSDKDAVETILSRCQQADVTPLAIDVTPPDIRDVGFTVIRVILPELVPLCLPSLPPSNHPTFNNTNLTRAPHPYP